MLTMFTLSDFVSERGENTVLRRVERERLGVRDRAILNQKLDRLLQMDFDLARNTRLPAGPLGGNLYKLRVFGNVMMRPRRWRMVVALAATGLYAQTQNIDTPRVRAFVATEQPHQPSALHEHLMNRVMIYLGDGQMTYTSPVGKVEKVQFKKGDVRWNPAMGPHISENITDQPFQMVEIELKGKAQTPPVTLSKLDPLKIDPKHYTLEFENDQVRVLRVRFGPNEKGLEHEHTYENIVVYLNDQARGKTGEMRIDGPRTHTEENPLDHPVERLSVDLK